MKMNKAMLKKLLKTYTDRLKIKNKEKECITVEIDGLVAITEKLENDLKAIEEAEKK